MTDFYEPDSKRPRVMQMQGDRVLHQLTVGGSSVGGLDFSDPTAVQLVTAARISNVLDPVDVSDVATRGYVTAVLPAVTLASVTAGAGEASLVSSTSAVNAPVTKKLTAGTNITLTNGAMGVTIAGTSVTLTSETPSAGEASLVSSSSTTTAHVTKKLTAGTNITLTNGTTGVTIAGTSVTMTSETPSAGEASLVSTNSAVNAPVTKKLTAGSNVTLTSSGTGVAIAATVPSVMLTSETAGTGEASLVSTNSAVNAPVTKKLTAGTNISLTNGAMGMTIAGTSVTLSSETPSAGEASLVSSNSTATAHVTKKLTAGTNISLTNGATGVTIAATGPAAVILTSETAGTGEASLVSTNSAVNAPVTKKLTAGTNVTLTSTGTDVAVAAAVPLTSETPNAGAGEASLVSTNSAAAAHVTKKLAAGAYISVADNGSGTAVTVGLSQPPPSSSPPPSAAAPASPAPPPTPSAAPSPPPRPAPTSAGSPPVPFNILFEPQGTLPADVEILGITVNVYPRDDSVQGSAFGTAAKVIYV